MQQEFHEHLTGAFQKLLTDIDAAAVRHPEGSVFKILRVLQIDDHAAAADEKATVVLQRLDEGFERLARGQRFPRRGMDLDHVREMLGV